MKQFCKILIALLALAPAAHADNSLAHRTVQSRPIQLGTSGGNINDDGRRFCCGGTLGCVVEGTNGTFYILSNNHALAMSNFGLAGDRITQPGLIDGDCFLNDSAAVATLTTFVPMLYRQKHQKWRNAPTNIVDVAIAEILPGKVKTDGSILEIGQPSTTTVQPFVGMAVKKSGRTTGITSGTIVAVDGTIIVAYSSTCGGKSKYKALFGNQIRILPSTFSNGGDSGSLVVEDVPNCPRPVGLLFAGGRSDTFANPIDDVLSALNVSIVGCSAASGMVTLASASVDAGSAPLLPGVAQETVKKAQHARRNAEDRLYRMHGVVGTGLSRSETDPSQAVIEVYVEKDTPGLRSYVPQQLDGTPVRIVETGKVVPY
jgi:hypothetical protein